VSGVKKHRGCVLSRVVVDFFFLGEVEVASVLTCHLFLSLYRRQCQDFRIMRSLSAMN
jgi:hypothetical protein